MSEDDKKRLNAYLEWLSLHPVADIHKLHDILMVIIRIMLKEEKERAV